MQIKSPNQYYGSKPDSGTIIILGRGLAQRWRRKLKPSCSCPAAHSELTEQNELSALLSTEAENPQAILWETNTEPSQLVRDLEKIPRAIPVLLRCTYSLCPEKNHRLLKLLKRRETQIKRSFPLRFWPPLCRLWEVIASNAAGPAHRIEINLTNDNAFKDNQTDTQVFAFPDLIDLCGCLMNESALQTKPEEIERQNLYTLEFPGQKKAVIKNQTKSAGTPSGIVEIRTFCKLAEIRLKFNPSIQEWQLERSFASRINPKPLPPLRLPDHDPVGLELNWFLRSKVHTNSSMRIPVISA